MTKNKIRIFAVLISFLYCNFSQAQNQNIDSLFSQYEAAILHNKTAKKDKINTETIAQRTLEAIYQTKNVDLLDRFHKTFSQEKKYAAEAKRIRDKLAFEQAQNANTIEAYEAFIKKYPDAIQINLALSFINEQKLQQYVQSQNTDSILAFANQIEDNVLRDKAKAEAEKIIFERALQSDKAKDYKNYLKQYPNGTYSRVAKEKYGNSVLDEELEYYKVSSLINFLSLHPYHNFYHQLLDTLKQIAIEYHSVKGLEFYCEHINDSSEDCIKFPLADAKRNVLKAPKKPVRLFANEPLPNYLPINKDTISTLELKSAFSDTDFFFFDEGNSVLFASNREDGYGTDAIKQSKQDTMDTPFDLYVAKRDNGKWKEPVLLLKPINNSFNQRNPVLSFNKKILFFSSNGYQTYGHRDIYVSYRNDTADWTSWSKPKLLSYEFNTNRNDNVEKYDGVSILLRHVGNDGKSTFNKLSRKNGKPMFVFGSGFAKDIDNNPTSATINIVNKATGKVIDSVESNPANGFFAFIEPEQDFAIIASKEGCVPSLLNNVISPVDSVKMLFSLNDINTLIERNKISVLSTLFDEKEQGVMSKISKLYLNYLAYEIDRIKQIVSISVFCRSGHKGMSAQDLAQVQANAVKAGLIESGLPSDKIIAVGYADKEDSNKTSAPNSRIEIGFISE
ncbi:MAG: OmpA family protein [Bacteroidales bacterium]|jgi:hypothetical protein|nr:OmpA family protein [Bacteroidales bacterium]